MPDDQTLNPNQSADTTNTSGAPVMPDPQKLVDEALGSPAPTTPTSPTDTPVSPEPSLPTEPAVPEPTVPAPDPAPTPEEKPADAVPPELLSPTDTPTPSTPPSEPTIPAAQPSTSMTDDMPLAFASAIPADMPQAPAESLPTAAAAPLPSAAAPLAAASMTPPKPEKKKRRGGKMMAVVAGFFLLVSSLWGGYWYYKHYLEEHPAIVAGVKDKNQDSCSGCYNGGWLKWRNGRCVHTGICGNTNEEKNTQNPNAEVSPTSCANGTCTCPGGYSYCGGGIGKCVSDATLQSHNGGCNRYGEVVYGIPTVYGANSQVAIKGQCTQPGFTKKCNCGNTTLCFDKTGYCDQKEANAIGASTNGEYNKYGLCATAGSYTSPGDPNAAFTLNPTYFDNLFKCDNNQCTAVGTQCNTIKHTCKGGNNQGSCVPTNTSIFLESTGYKGPNQSTGFTGKCGTVEQIDVTCDGVYTQSRTRINPPCAEKSPNPSPSTPSKPPTLSCVSLKKDNTALEVGKKITFTCEGASNPAGAVTLNYQYRLMKDGGAWQTLTTNAQKKAEYTIPSAGAYKVQCRACGNIAALAKNVCDPEWTGATQ